MGKTAIWKQEKHGIFLQFHAWQVFQPLEKNFPMAGKFRPVFPVNGKILVLRRI
jgi:hypothetical protein